MNKGDITEAMVDALRLFSTNQPLSDMPGKFGINVKVAGDIFAQVSPTSLASRLIAWRDYQNQEFNIASGKIDLYSVSVINTGGAQDLYVKFYDNPIPDISSDPVRWTLHVPEGATVNITNELMPYLTFENSLSFACVVSINDSDITAPDVTPLVQFQYILNP